MCNGIDDDKYMYEMLQLVQTQKEWIQGEIYKWTHPDEIIIDDNKNWFYPSHNEDLTNRLNRYKVLYLEKKISVYEYCKERENIQKEDINFRSHFRY